MTHNDRLFEFFNYLKKEGKIASQVELATILNTNPAGINDIKGNRKNLSIENLMTMKKSYPELNTDWILMEEGDMILTQKEVETTSEYVLRTDTRQELQRIPLYDHLGAASLTKVFEGHQNIIDYITIPNLPKSDGALYITGDSMYPLLKSGDIAIYKRLFDMTDGILFGEMYILSVKIDDDFTTVVKFVQKSEKGEEWIRLVSQNTHHAPKDFHLSDVVAMAMVKASIRINSMM